MITVPVGNSNFMIFRETPLLTLLFIGGQLKYSGGLDFGRPNTRIMPIPDNLAAGIAMVLLFSSVEFEISLIVNSVQFKNLFNVNLHKQMAYEHPHN